MNTSELDSIRINFSTDDLFLLNFALALIMYGVALELRWKDFNYLANNPKGFFLGIFSQFLALPCLTFLLVTWISPPPSIALGMFMVAACPGGNVSNFLSAFAKGNTALSVSLTAFSTAFSIVLTPLNFAFWAGLHEPSSVLLKEIRLDISDVFFTIGIILGIPMILGIMTRQLRSKLADQLMKFLQPLSILIFAAIIILAFLGNFELFLQLVGLIFLWVFSHNLLALGTGFLTAKIGKLPLPDQKTLTIETGIQNSGLGLVLIFTYFQGLGGMAIIAAWWGIWHLISGLILAAFWRTIA
ncbi:MAG: bile acid:sodium symporter family protein [Cyclobacteriaceae bacterium]|nr:bile acid:sodium symporter family protein [Cyclobacteriaceae bacterium]MDX5466102.1 bile acid:sodium symporter family protein [Cyclobacteriaceae bacterium]